MDLVFSQTAEGEVTGLIQAELGLLILLSLAALLAIISSRIRLPYTVTLVLAGLALSFVPNPFEFDLSSELILFLLVPPLIFEATIGIRWQNLRRNLALILLLAVVGTLIGTFLVGSILTLAGRVLVPELHVVLGAAFAFGALISATDPVAVIALFRDLGISKRLSLLVEGESLFNDGVAVVIFGIILEIGATVTAGEAEVLNFGLALTEFLWVSLGGLAIGIVLGYLISYLVLKNIDDHLVETAMTVALAFGAFLVAEQFHVSGVLAVVAAGILVGNIGVQSTSPTTRLTLENFWEFMAFVVNSMVFLLIGLESDLSRFRPNLSLVLVVVLTVLFSRAVVVYGLTWIHGRLDTERRLPAVYRHVIFWGGLRGAISLALALSVTAATFDQEVVLELRQMTFAVVLFTVVVQGTTIAPLMRRLGLTEEPEQVQQQQRRQALFYAARAGKRELDRLYDDGILSLEIWEAMSEVYQEQIRQRNTKLRDLLHQYPELEQSMILQVRRELLQAERTAMRDANIRGLISEDLYRELIQETDNRAAALDLIQEAMGIERLE